MNWQITPKQLTFLITGNTLAIAFLSLPRVVSADARQDAWLAVILSAVVPLVTLVLIERMGRLFPGKNFIEVSHLLFGKILGTLLIVGAIVYFSFYSVVVVGSFVRIVSYYILPKTPFSILLLAVMICIMYVVLKGIYVVAWFTEITMYAILFVMLIFLIPGFSGDYTNLLPVGGAGIVALGKGVLQATWAQAGIEILLVLYFMVDRPQEVLKSGTIAIGTVTFFYLLITTVSLLVYGPEALQDLMWPGISILKAVNVVVFGRLEIFFLTIWLAFATRTTITSSMAGAYVLTELINRGSQIYLYSALFLGLIIYILACIPANIVEFQHYTNFGAYGFIVLGLLYPLLYLILAMLRREKVV